MLYITTQDKDNIIKEIQRTISRYINYIRTSGRRKRGSSVNISK